MARVYEGGILAQFYLLNAFMTLLIAYTWLHVCVRRCPQGSLLITSGFSLYLGNVFPVAMDYLRCAAGSVSDHHSYFNHMLILL